MVKKIISICSILVSIILMTTPFGVAMTFVPNPSERITRYFSYFSSMPFGYGNWFPFISALISIVVFFLLLIGIKKPNVAKAVQACVAICIMCSVLSWVIFHSISIVGICVSGLHIIVLIIQRQQTSVIKNV
jgi:hypothetical protein